MTGLLLSLVVLKNRLEAKIKQGTAQTRMKVSQCNATTPRFKNNYKQISPVHINNPGAMLLYQWYITKNDIKAVSNTKKLDKGFHELFKGQMLVVV